MFCKYTYLGNSQLEDKMYDACCHFPPLFTFFVFQDENSITREAFCLSQYAEMLKTFLKANAKNSTDFFFTNSKF